MKQAEYLSEETVILALRSALGRMDIAAKDLGLSRGQLQDYIVNHPAVREEKKQIKEALIDEAEEELARRMKNSDSLLIFFLRTQARERGYEPSLPIVGADGKNLSVQIDARSLIAAMREGAESAIGLDDGVQKELSDFSSNGD